jgi:hypothetical protein
VQALLHPSLCGESAHALARARCVQRSLTCRGATLQKLLKQQGQLDEARALLLNADAERGKEREQVEQGRRTERDMRELLAAERDALALIKVNEQALMSQREVWVAEEKALSAKIAELVSLLPVLPCAAQRIGMCKHNLVSDQRLHVRPSTGGAGSSSAGNPLPERAH